jgi:hypothetical protein
MGEVRVCRGHHMGMEDLEEVREDRGNFLSNDLSSDTGITEGGISEAVANRFSIGDRELKKEIRASRSLETHSLI